jgi:hypothetical protein
LRACPFSTKLGCLVNFYEEGLLVMPTNTKSNSSPKATVPANRYTSATSTSIQQLRASDAGVWITTENLDYSGWVVADDPRLQTRILAIAAAAFAAGKDIQIEYEYFHTDGPGRSWFKGVTEAIILP